MGIVFVFGDGGDADNDGHDVCLCGLLVLRFFLFEQVIEESPSCLITPQTRLAMQEQAIMLSKATGYRCHARDTNRISLLVLPLSLDNMSGSA